MYSEFSVTEEDSRASALAGCFPSGYALHLDEVAGNSKPCISSTSAGKTRIFTSITSCSTSSQLTPTPSTYAPLLSPQTTTRTPSPAATVILQHRNPSNWTLATPLTRHPNKTDTLLSDPKITPSTTTFPQKYNTTSALKTTTCVTSQPHNYNTTSTSPTTFAPLSPSTSSIPTTPPSATKSPTIGITAGILLVVVGLSCICGMLFLLRGRRRILKDIEEGKDKASIAEKRDRGAEGGRETEGSCCEWRRFEMEGVGRPPEMESGLDHGALVRYEMSAG